MKEIKYDPNLITQEMIALRARDICCRDWREDGYLSVASKIQELKDLVTYLAIKELKAEFEETQVSILGEDE